MSGRRAINQILAQQSALPEVYQFGEVDAFAIDSLTPPGIREREILR